MNVLSELDESQNIGGYLFGRRNYKRKNWVKPQKQFIRKI